tara:strand:- start:27 stop:344 length:318 start_codon:yes stop_codon:yes gene_type:complete
MYNIAIIYPKKLYQQHKHPNYRLIHYINCEEGIAALSLFGNLIHILIVYEKCSFLKGTEIKLLINKQYPELPVLIINDTDILDYLANDDNFLIFLSKTHPKIINS